jgi:hypothetical protein
MTRKFQMIGTLGTRGEMSKACFETTIMHLVYHQDVYKHLLK